MRGLLSRVLINTGLTPVDWPRVGISRFNGFSPSERCDSKRCNKEAVKKRLTRLRGLATD